ncbi:MAG: LacI family transcriptional regulator, partial [Enterobacterales bacterium]
ESINFLISRNCDALIMHVEGVSDDYLIELNKSSTPFVLMNRRVPSLNDNCIILNNHNGGYLATQYLIDLGHKNIAYISGPSWKSDSQDRLKGHKQALKDSGLKYNKSLTYEGDYKRESGITGLEYILKAKQPFTAVVCANDEMASGAMVKARDENFDIPRKLSIVGYDDINVASYLHPKLTTIRNPVNEIGQMAAKWVLKNVYNKDTDETQTMFEPELIIRDSAQQLV